MINYCHFSAATYTINIKKKKEPLRQPTTKKIVWTDENLGFNQFERGQDLHNHRPNLEENMS